MRERWYGYIPCEKVLRDKFRLLNFGHVEFIYFNGIVSDDNMIMIPTVVVKTIMDL